MLLSLGLAGVLVLRAAGQTRRSDDRGRRAVPRAHRSLRAQLKDTRHASETALNERAQLERDLHDGAAQRVLGLQLGLSRARSHARTQPLARELERLERHARLLRDDLRKLSQGIYPSSLVESGVVPALLDAMVTSDDRVDISGSIPRLPQHIEHALYFCALEAIQNVVAHAGGWTNANVEFTTAHETVVCRVSDEGVGFEVGQPAGDGIGLRGMRERIAAVGGSLAIQSAPGRGTAVTAIVPIPNGAE